VALFRDQDAIKEKDRFDLILAPCLLPYHALAGAYQMAIFRLHPGGNVNALDVAASEVPGKLPAVHLVGFAGFLFMLRGDIGGVDDHGMDPFFC
jgi:hypothetical protein